MSRPRKLTGARAWFAAGIATVLTLSGCSGKAPERKRGGISLTEFRKAFSDDAATTATLSDTQLQCVADSLFDALPIASVKAIATNGVDAVTATPEDQQFTSSALATCVPLSVWVGNATQGLSDAESACIDADTSMSKTQRLQLWTALVSGSQPSDAVMKAVDKVVNACVQE